MSYFFKIAQQGSECLSLNSVNPREVTLLEQEKKVAQYSTVQILQTVNLLPWSSTGDNMDNLCSKTTLIPRRPLCLLNVDTAI